MGEINLDEARQARLEAQDERSFIFKGEKFVLPAELPYAVLEPIAALAENEKDLGALYRVTEGLLEDEHDRFVALKPSLADMNVLLGGIFDEYGLTAGGDGDGISPKLPPSSQQ